MLTDRLPDLDYNHLVSASRRVKSGAGAPLVKLALLSDAATQQFVPVFKTLFDRRGIRVEIYEGSFDGIELEVRDPASGLYAFEPNAYIIINSIQSLRGSFLRRTTNVSAFLGDTVGRMTGIWDAIQSRSSGVIIQSTFALPLERFFGNFDLRVSESFYSAAIKLNAEIVAAARSRNGVLIHDVEGVASLVGRQHFFDDRLWDLWKSFCALEYLPQVANNIVDIVCAMQGRIVKCVVLDLDNTLWGGVIGDDGVEGIKLDAHGDGEGFYRFQLFLKELRARGILLAVCSKNDEVNALLPFQQHPAMVLRRDDITLFVANWKNKAQNLRYIRDTLNIGFDSMVFLDDNPFERNLVRELLPTVVVPELPEDPSDYVRFLCELNLFETVSFSEEDLRRPELYQREAERREAAAGFGSVDAFLQSLEMQITVARFDLFHLPRIAQLIQRSNQFNLTTRRHTEADCESMMRSDSVVPLYARLLDRLGDHGLISIVILKPQGDDLVITDWLMSCRVLSRGVEQYMMNKVFDLARSFGLKRVIGEYVPTSKNGMVREFFVQFGFSILSDHKGTTRWSCETADYAPKETYIKIAKSETEMPTAPVSSL